jgi:hypothetical protein
MWWAGSFFAGVSFLCLCVAIYPKVKHRSATKGVTYFGDVAALEMVDELRAALKRSETTPPSAASPSFTSSLASSIGNTASSAGACSRSAQRSCSRSPPCSRRGWHSER